MPKIETKVEGAIHLPTVLQLGMSGGGMNSDYIYAPSTNGDWMEDRSLLQVHGLFRNMRLADQRRAATANEQCREALAFADELVRRWNSYEALLQQVAALEARVEVYRLANREDDL